jgi:hypothetical protein
MIRIFLKNDKVMTFELGHEKKEMDLVARYHHGLDGNTVLNLKTNDNQTLSRIKVSEIKNMQHLKNMNAEPGANSPLHVPQDSLFKTREEYEKWKRQKIRAMKRNVSQQSGQKRTAM